MNLSRSATKLLLAEGGRALLSFLFIVLFARVATATDIGTYFLFEAAVALLVWPADPGVSKSLKKRLSEGTPLEFVLPAASLMVLPTILIISALLFIFRAPLHAYLGAPIVSWVVLGLVARVATRIVMAGIEGQLRVGEVPILLFGQTVLWTVGGGGLLILDWGITGVILARIGGDVLIVGWGALRLVPATSTRVSFGVSREHVKSLFDFAKYAAVTSIGGVTYGWMDVGILGLFVAQSAVGAYEIAWRVTMLPFLVGATVSRTLFPQISSWDANDARIRIEEILPNAIIPTTAVTIPALVGVIILGEEILHYVFSPEYTVATAALVILMAEKILQSVHILFGRALQAIDRADSAAKATVVAVVVNIVLNFALIPVWGLSGAALATVLSFAVNTVLHARYLSQSITISIPWRTIGWTIVAAGGMGTTLYLWLRIAPVDGLVSLFGSITAAIICYLGILLINPTLRRMAKNQYSVIHG